MLDPILIAEAAQTIQEEVARDRGEAISMRNGRLRR
jgi:hypothetical protein